ncbi:MAG: hypothetical protein GY775_19310 [Candidatus Scalindua sp.]|nr:hypothetical protein [Candidatus Scalindua sp.]
MGNSYYTDDGIIKFYDGTIIAIEDQEYSPDGINNWEKTFNPNDHISSLDGVTPIKGHVYKRVKHSGDIDFQLPYRIVPEGVEMRTLNGELQYKLSGEDDSEWKSIFDLTTLQGEDGEKGEQGIPGEGFHIDIYGYYKDRPDCSGSLSASNCNSCNPGNNTSNEAVTFMSLGDGYLELTQALITAGTVTVDSVAYTHFSNDLNTWTPLTGGIVDFKARYLATNGTGAVYTDMRTENYYNTQGIVYICADGNWIVLTNIATPSYQVGESTGSTNIGYLDNFINAALTNFVPDTIGLNADGKLEVAEQSINETSFIQTTFGDGLDIPAATDKPQLKVSDVAGFGLLSYTSTANSLDDLQVLVDPLLGNGLGVQTGIAVDGETANLAQVDLTQLINNNSGLKTVVQGDTFNDLEVNLGDGLKLDGGTPQAITVNVDDSSLEVNATNLHVKPYSTGNDGILTAHLNPDVIYSNRGLALDTTNGLYALVDASTVGYNGTGQLEIPLNGVTGDRLNDNTADNTKGLEVSNDMLTVKVDSSTIGFNGSGQLTYTGAAGQLVSSITAGGSTLRDDIIFTTTSTDGSIDSTLTGTVDPGSDTMVLDIQVDTTWLDNYITLNHPASATAWGAITGTITNQTDLVSYISGLNHVVLDTYYNNAQISSTHGLVVKAVSGEEYRVIVDANGNLDTASV